MSNCKNCDCDHQDNNSSGFMLGIVLGAIIGAVIAVLIYKHNKSQIIKDLQSKLGSYFKQNPLSHPASASKTPVVPRFASIRKPVKMFRKPKK